jgi:hypothetical protein
MVAKSDTPVNRSTVGPPDRAKKPKRVRRIFFATQTELRFDQKLNMGDSIQAEKILSKLSKNSN